MRTTGGMTRALLTSAGIMLATAAAGAGCYLEPSVPGEPTYEADVKPILEARCIRCHGYPQLEGATEKVRFDLFECPTTDAGPPCSAGAKIIAPVMKVRLLLSDDAAGHMPPKPAAPLSKYQVDTIVKWADEKPAPQ
jgi:hypothetical protein